MQFSHRAQVVCGASVQGMYLNKKAPHAVRSIVFSSLLREPFFRTIGVNLVIRLGFRGCSENIKVVYCLNLERNNLVNITR